jgi:hypothetical protein
MTSSLEKIENRINECQQFVERCTYINKKYWDRKLIEAIRGFETVW